MATMTLNQLDDAIRSGSPSVEVWTRFGRLLGMTLEDIVVRRQALRRRKSAAPWREAPLPLFAGVGSMPRRSAT